MALKVREYLLKLINFLSMASSPTIPSAHFGLLNTRPRSYIQDYYDAVVRQFVSAGDDVPVSLQVTEIFFAKQYQVNSAHEYLVATVRANDNSKHYIFVERQRDSKEDPPRVSSPTTSSQPTTGTPQTPASVVDDCQPATTLDDGHQPQDPPLTMGTPRTPADVVDDCQPATTLDDGHQPQDPPPSMATPRTPADVVDDLQPNSSDNSALPPLQILTHRGVFISFTESLFSSSPKAATHVAADEVTITGLQLHNKADTITGRIDCEGRLHLHELVIVALMVHDSNLSYQLFGTNCYWYAGSIMAIIEKLIGRRMRLLSSGDANGKCLQVTLFQRPDEDKLEEAMAHFEVYSKRFKSEVASGRRPLIEAEKKADKAEKKADTAEKKADRAEKEADLARKEAAREREEKVVAQKELAEARAMIKALERNT